MRKILMHACCGPCAIYPLEHLRSENFDIMGYFYNPNIHPFTEWQKRKQNFQKFAKSEKMKVIIDENYDLEAFLQNIVHRESKRCWYCYTMRLFHTASIAKRGKFDAFTTTLLVSPFQKHELIKKAGEVTASKYGVEFYYVDFRSGFKEAYKKAKATGHYLQQYCGCIYSERDRYMPKKQ
ncbi:epoxyqueuosine reductase QueH [Peptococcaceae bacterium]|nr:epoxyqueuosine reductase QueH [Peptococcaceae bacterium]